MTSHCIFHYLIGLCQYLDIYIRSPYSRFIIVGDITGHQQRAVEVWSELLFSLNYSYISLVVGDFLPKVEKVNISITSCEHPNLLFWKVYNGIVGHQLKSILAKKNVTFSFKTISNYRQFLAPWGNGCLLHILRYDRKFTFIFT